MLQLPPKRRQVIRMRLRESSFSTPVACGSCHLGGTARVPDSELVVHSCNSQVNADVVGEISCSGESIGSISLKLLIFAF